MSWIIVSCNKKDGTLPPTATPAVQVDVLIIMPDTFSLETETNGTISASEYVELKPELSGRIIELNIREGSAVQSGTLLMKLNDEDMKAQLRKYKAQLSIAEKTLERLKKLIDIDAVNQQEYDLAQSTSEGLKADVEYAQAMINKTELRAPFSGVIGLRNVSKGAYVTPEQVIATLQQITDLKVDFVLPEAQSYLLKIGMTVLLRSSGKRNYTAKVIAVEPQINQGTRNVKFRAVVEGDTSDLMSGGFVTVIISGTPDHQAIQIPTNCIIADSRTKKVAMIKNGKVKFQSVETGYRSESEVLITQGLTPGDTIAVTGLLFLKPDAAVKIRSVK